MPGYSHKAQPYLDAIAAELFGNPRSRDWLIQGTPADPAFIGSDILIEEQRRVRWRFRRTIQPFWANYHCGRDRKCSCREDGTGIESDAIFFLRNSKQRVLAVHVEYKHPNESFGAGQVEAYARRAACFRDTFSERRTLNPHDDWVTAIFCDDVAATYASRHFQRVITHDEARSTIDGYP